MTNYLLDTGSSNEKTNGPSLYTTLNGNRSRSS